jgi:hypothetical protein
MSKYPNTRRKGRRLLILLAVLILLVLLYWILLGCPALTAQGAFRRALANAMLPDRAPLELQIEIPYGGTAAIGSDGSRAYKAMIWRTGQLDMIWESDSARDFPAVDGICYAELYGCYPHASLSTDLYSDAWYTASGKYLAGPVVAVKTGGIPAELALRLTESGDLASDVYVAYDYFVSGTYPLAAGETVNGWTLFYADLTEMKSRYLDYTNDTVAFGAEHGDLVTEYEWYREFLCDYNSIYDDPSFLLSNVDAAFVLTLHPEGGTAKTVSWKP